MRCRVDGSLSARYLQRILAEAGGRPALSLSAQFAVQGFEGFFCMCKDLSVERAAARAAYSLCHSQHCIGPVRLLVFTVRRGCGLLVFCTGCSR